MKEVSTPRAAVSGCLAQWTRCASHTGRGSQGMLFWGGSPTPTGTKLGGGASPGVLTFTTLIWGRNILQQLPESEAG